MVRRQYYSCNSSFFTLRLATPTQVPQLRPYNGYVMTTSPVLLPITTSLIGYRLYTAASRTIKKREVYVQHVREAPLTTSRKDKALTNTIKQIPETEQEGQVNNLRPSPIQYRLRESDEDTEQTHQLPITINTPGYSLRR